LASRAGGAFFEFLRDFFGFKATASPAEFLNSSALTVRRPTT
jgi:hypothetical protein